MTDSTVIDVDPSSTVDFDTDHFSFLPLDDSFFSNNGDGNDVVPLEDLDFDFNFDDLEIPLSENGNDLTGLAQTQIEPQADQFRGVFKSSSPELRHVVDQKCDLSQQSWEGSGVLSSHADPVQVLEYLNVHSPESNGENPGGGEKGLNFPSPDTQGSENYGSNVSEESNNCPVSSTNINFSVVDQKVELEFINDDNYSKNFNSPKIDGTKKCYLKRKKEGNDLTGSISSSKYRKSNECDEGKSNCNNDNNDPVLSEEEEKRKARLMRNRESAQLSRQRKKHYVEELEEKIRSMHSTIQDLHSKISYFMAENVALRQQMSSGGSGNGSTGGGGVVPSPMVAPPPGMYPPVMYPWMACPPPYMMKPQGSQVPLVPIPRLKPQQATLASKPIKKETSKKVDGKKNEGTKTKKVAGVSFLGLLFFFMLVIGLVPMVSQRYGGFSEVLTGEGSYGGGRINREHHERLLMVNGTEYSEANIGRKDCIGDGNVRCGRKGHSSGGELSADEFVRLGNGSQPLAASLYVPRNDKLIKIDGNLIIHSILASEKAMASREETGLVPVPSGPPHLRALGSGSAGKESAGSTNNDGKLHQWFREGLTAPMLNTGMCTEVFQFDVSAASSSGAIVQATTPTNTSEQHNKNSTQLSKTRNRRILHGLPIPLPIPESTRNISSADSSEQQGNLKNSSTSSSMVVSVLFDPRESGDSDVDGVMGTKSLSRIFVVVLIDSVKYVTYSCMLPFKASSAPLVTT